MTKFSPLHSQPDWQPFISGIWDIPTELCSCCWVDYAASENQGSTCSCSRLHAHLVLFTGCCYTWLNVHSCHVGFMFLQQAVAWQETPVCIVLGIHLFHTHAVHLSALLLFGLVYLLASMSRQKLKCWRTWKIYWLVNLFESYLRTSNTGQCIL